MSFRYVVQLVEAETGKRSEPFTVTKETYKKVLDAVLGEKEEEKLPKYGVLVNLEYDRNDEMFISTAPIMNLKSFQHCIENRKDV
jgi:hypothetical protein